MKNKVKSKVLTLTFVLIAFLIVFVGSTNLNLRNSLKETFSSGFVYGYGGGGGSTTYDVESSLADAGDTITKSLSSGYGIRFKLDGESHTIRLDKIYSSSVRLKISSDTFYTTVGLGEIRKVDINANDYYDMAITLKSLTSTRATLEFEMLPDTEKVTVEAEEPAAEEPAPTEPTTEPTPETEEAEIIPAAEPEEGQMPIPLTGRAISPPSGALIAGLIVLIVVCVAVIVIVLVRMQKHKKRHLSHR